MPHAAPPRTAAVRAPGPVAGHSWLMPHGRPSNSHRQVCFSLLWRSLLSQGPDEYKVLFVPSKCLWRVWGLTLKAIAPLLPSCYGFFFALEHEVSLFGGFQHSPVKTKRCLLLGRRAVTNLDSVLKSKDITLLTKVHTVKAMLFPVVMYGCQSWTIKKTEHQVIDAFELWCCTRLFRIPWTKRKPNQSILKEINPHVHWKDWCGSWSSNTLASWCKEPTHWSKPWCWEGLREGGVGDGREWDGWMASQIQ